MQKIKVKDSNSNWEATRLDMMGNYDLKTDHYKTPLTLFDAIRMLKQIRPKYLLKRKTNN